MQETSGFGKFGGHLLLKIQMTFSKNHVIIMMDSSALGF
ncbi:hypothetical protein LBBP_00409 [Leptospira borgpetersenii serovar Ballum]|uniref:Uncharacterized protein n=1 Tax=Leptospira borgpetersenii serovar Ballum TaxID=280505 RepID=A0A0S2IM63_LEPBO|nr:hypothetical protein LBBP_00409 [Leptospira borgpetersenii serovar Ballum]